MSEKAEIEKKNKVLSELKIEYVAANTIRPNSYNPNRQSDHDFHLLVMSMTEDGFTQPIIVHKDSREIVDGEHRWTCSIVTRFIKKYGIKVNAKNKDLPAELEKVRASGLCQDVPTSVKDGKELVGVIRKNRVNVIDPTLTIPVVFVAMTPEQMRIATLRHNRARGSEDIELTAALLRDLRELGALDWAQDSLQLDDTEMNRLLEDIAAPEALASVDFSEAWQPSADTGRASVTADEKGAASVSMTPQAVERMREQEKKIAAAKTEEERVQVQKDMDIFRLSVIFSGEEATTVKAVLADRPAVKILELCKKELGQ